MQIIFMGYIMKNNEIYSILLSALSSCKATNTRDAYGTPYVHYYFDEDKVNKAKELLLKDKNINQLTLNF